MPPKPFLNINYSPQAHGFWPKGFCLIQKIDINCYYHEIESWNNLKIIKHTLSRDISSTISLSSQKYTNYLKMSMDIHCEIYNRHLVAVF